MKLILKKKKNYKSVITVLVCCLIDPHCTLYCRYIHFTNMEAFSKAVVENNHFNAVLDTNGNGDECCCSPGVHG